jgi:hypothetical protein
MHDNPSSTAHPHGRRALPVRSDHPLCRWQQPRRARAQQPVPHSRKGCSACHPLPQPLHHQHKADYRLLHQVTAEQAWEEWLLYVLRGVEDTARWTTAKIAAIRALADHTATQVHEQLPSIYSHELVDTIFEQPYCRIDNLVEKGIAKRQTASVYLKKLVEIGVLVEQQAAGEAVHHPSSCSCYAQQNGFELYR